MKKILLGILCGVIITSSSVFAGDNTIKIAPSVKSSDKIGFPFLELEYERKILPLTSAYIKFAPTASVEDGSNSFEYSTYSFGARYNVLFFHVGVGYESTTGTYSDSSSDASIAISGFLFEIGKTFGMGPLSLGVGYAAHMADVSIGYDSDEFSISNFSAGSQTFHKIHAEIGYNF